MKMIDSEWKYFRWIKIVKMIFWILFGTCLTMAIVLQVAMRQTDSFFEKEDILVLEGWQIETDFGFYETIELPARVPHEKGESITIANTLPQKITDHDKLFICGFHEDIVVKVDGEICASYDNRKYRLFGTSSPNMYLVVDLDSEYAGKFIEIELYTGMRGPMVVNEIQYGTKISFFDNILEKYASMLIIAAMLVIIGICFIFFAFVTNVVFGKKQGFHYLGAFPMMIGLIIFSGTYVRQFYMADMGILTFLTYMGIDLCAIPLLCFLDEIQQYRYKEHYVVLKTVYIVSFVIALILHIAKIVDLASSVYAFHGLMTFSVIMILVLFLLDLKRYRRPEVFETLIALGLGSVFMIAELIRVDVKSETIWGTNIAIGVLIFLIAMTFTTMRQVQRREHDNFKMIEASETKNAFFANVSHEIRTPLNVMLGMNEMILRESNSEELTSYAENIQESGRSLLYLINNILDISKIESGKMEIVNQVFDLTTLLDNLYFVGKERAGKFDNHFSLEVSPDLPDNIIADEQHIRQIMVNFISNAMKYTKAGEVVLGVRMEPVGPQKYVIIFYVRDNGIGIRPDDQKYLFEDFRRVDVEKNRGIEGTGLGLSISKELATLMHGRIDVKSEYGSGSEFSLILPIDWIGNKKIGEYIPGSNTDHNKKIEHGFIAPDARVLVVDDNSMNIEVVKSLLKRSGMEIDSAESGKDCLNRCKTKKYHAILLDQMMPEMDGIETLEKAKNMEESLNKDTPFIAVTANAVLGAKEMLLEKGFSDYVSKPISWENLEKVLQRNLPEDMVIQSTFDSEKNVFTEEEIEQYEKLLKKYDIHLEEGLRYTGEDFYQYAKFLELYHHSYEKIRNELESSLTEETIDYYTVKVHALKGNAKSFGALDLFYTAQRMEKRGRQKDYAYLKNAQPLLLLEMERAYQGSEAFLDASGLWETKKTESEKVDYTLSKIQLDQIYEQILEYVEELQSSEAIRLIKEIRKYHLDELTIRYLDELEKYLEDMDYDSAESFLQNRDKSEE